jgi:hypothetical protein
MRRSEKGGGIRSDYDIHAFCPFYIIPLYNLYYDILAILSRKKYVVTGLY